MKDLINKAKGIFGKKGPSQPKAKKKKVVTTDSAKDKATARGEPYVEVITLEVDAKNPSQGAFELEWNDLFVEELKRNGYRGNTDEDIVDVWFQQICKNVALSQWETFDEDNRQRSLVTKTNVGDGRTEVK
tara:strand:+ start:72 stop:464 length:393 start_codon:yes stop_codon:yes gene_type:complete